jgi:hypothetical protein
VTSLSADGDEGGRWQISSAGGRFPVWTRGGREILFEAADGKLMAADITLEPSFAAGIPTALFDLQRRGLQGQQWDVTPDGTRYLVNQLAEQPLVDPITLVQNWVADLEGWAK